MNEQKDIYTFPQNYDTPGKLLGIFDYTSVFIILGWGGSLFGILRFIPCSLDIKIYGFMFLFIPVAVFTLAGINNDSIFSFLVYARKFLKNAKVYLYTKK